MNQKLKKDLLSVKKPNNGDGTVTWKASSSRTPRSAHQNNGMVRADLHPISEPVSDFVDGRFNCRGDYVTRGGR
ncbi:hypothetical protein [Acetobacter lovaniensis]|uniref:Uncharacterized protein n=1 Tax=Acetobacter lovaniensis TaxID=104100 RepID=A0A841QIR5_9PROT|nr:hypothetical protein [Acetobacter lovaniensis]MBB6457882.1 hypothetical protein [Acetobacter lovaniensis]NHN82146.1 hypothetical protein [Acetobacter lovaniensis]GBQ66270.1 hypothetical protein AA0474_1072 [Acetobacter lovaniensis NRIC 0474]